MSIYGEKVCDTCRYWGGERSHNDDNPLGRCRVMHPTMGQTEALAYHDPDRPTVPGPLIQRGVWPWTAIDDWCGKHEAKNATQHL